MTPEELKARTKAFALRVIKLVRSLPNDPVARHIGGQLVRSGTSVAANYRASCRARSTADFISKMTIVEEECDESAFWIEISVDTGTVRKELVADLLDKADQLVSIFVSLINTARKRKR